MLVENRYMPNHGKRSVVDHEKLMCIEEIISSIAGQIIAKILLFGTASSIYRSLRRSK